jgi:hypothetical protein
MTESQHQELIDLTWRYAAFIGIVDMSDIFTNDILEEDKRDWSHLIKQSQSGLPVFHEADAIEFVQTHSGMRLEDCRKVLNEEWDEKTYMSDWQAR